MLPPALTLAGNELTGTEGNGVIQLTGTFSAIRFIVPVAEPFPGWGGFTVGARAAQ